MPPMPAPSRGLRWALKTGAGKIKRRTLDRSRDVDDLWNEDVPAEVEWWRR